MTDRGINLSPIKWLGLVITIIALTNIAVFLDVPGLREICGFIFLTFVPGYLILTLLKLNRLSLLVKVILSLGLSVAFSILFGLILNSSLLALGYTKPLSTVPLLVSFSSATVILAIFAYIRNKGTTFSFPNLGLTLKEKALLIVPALLPLLSIIGIYLLNLNDDNLVSMVLLLLIPAYVIFIAVFHSKLPEGVYPGLIYLIGVALLLRLSLRSSHIIGADVHDMYYLFQLAFQEGHWSLFSRGLLDACLSISLLPSIYQTFLNINSEFLFKILYPLLFSVSPLVVYIIAKRYMGSFYALLASFLFMSQVIFLGTAGASSTNLAILFFALSIMVLLHQDMSNFTKGLFFIIFAISCIMSHYSTAYIFFFVLLFAWLGKQIISRILLHKRKPVASSENPIAAPEVTGTGAPRSQLKRGITITLTILFFVVLFLWYSQVTAEPFNQGIGLIQRTFTNLHQFFLMEARGATATAALSESAFYEGIPQSIRFVLSWLIIAFIATGILTTMVRYKKMVSLPNPSHIKPSFLRSKLDSEYFTLSLACIIILVFSIAFPYIQKGYSMERTYFQTLVVLSPFFIIGGITVAKWLRARPYWIVLMVLIPYFMCTTGTMYQLFGVPGGITLNSAGKEYDQLYVHEQETYATRWIKEYTENGVPITTSGDGGERLASQGGISESQAGRGLYSMCQQGMKIGGYIYLAYQDVIDGQLVAEYPDVFADKNKIYENGGSEVYR